MGVAISMKSPIKNFGIILLHCWCATINFPKNSIFPPANSLLIIKYSFFIWRNTLECSIFYYIILIDHISLQKFYCRRKHKRHIAIPGRSKFNTKKIFKMRFLNELLADVAGSMCNICCYKIVVLDVFNKCWQYYLCVHKGTYFL